MLGARPLPGALTSVQGFLPISLLCSTCRQIAGSLQVGGPVMLAPAPVHKVAAETGRQPGINIACKHVGDEVGLLHAWFRPP